MDNVKHLVEGSKEVFVFGLMKVYYDPKTGQITLDQQLNTIQDTDMFCILLNRAAKEQRKLLTREDE